VCLCEQEFPDVEQFVASPQTNFPQDVPPQLHPLEEPEDLTFLGGARSANIDSLLQQLYPQCKQWVTGPDGKHSHCKQLPGKTPAQAPPAVAAIFAGTAPEVRDADKAEEAEEIKEYKPIRATGHGESSKEHTVDESTNMAESFEETRRLDVPFHQVPLVVNTQCPLTDG